MFRYILVQILLFVKLGLISVYLNPFQKALASIFLELPLKFYFITQFVKLS